MTLVHTQKGDILKLLKGDITKLLVQSTKNTCQLRILHVECVLLIPRSDVALVCLTYSALRRFIDN